MKNNKNLFTREQKQDELIELMKEKYNLTVRDVKRLINKENKKGSLLTEEEKVILNLKFGIEDGKIRTLQEIGEVIGYSHSRTSQKMHLALTKLYAYKF